MINGGSATALLTGVNPENTARNKPKIEISLTRTFQQVPSEGVHDLERTIVEKEKILTQLGAFRRQLAQEHHKLEERIRGESS